MHVEGSARPREAYAHEAVLVMEPGGDERAPGGAVTVALCGSWSHEPPCPLAPHHTTATRAGDGLRVRVLFAADPDDEQEVRARIDGALGAGAAATPGGATARWRLTSSGPSPVRDAERQHADRLTRT